MDSYEEVIEAWLAPQPPQGKKWHQIKHGDLKVSFWGKGIFWAEVFSAFKANHGRKILLCDGLPEELVTIITHIAQQYGYKVELGVCPSEFLKQ